MPTCSECGIDIPGEGLCPECRTERERRGRSGARSGGRWNIALVLVGAAVVFGAAFLIGRYVGGGQNPPAQQNADRQAATAGAHSDSTPTAEVNKTADAIAGSAGSSESESTAGSAAAEAAPNPGVSENSEAAAAVAGAVEAVAAEVDVPLFDITKRPVGPAYDSKETYLAWMLENTDQKEEFLLMKWARYGWIQSWSKIPALTHERVLQGFLKTPREYFCREWNLKRAYDHAYMSIGWGQTISGPEIVARMTNALNPEPDHKVLEIGTGSGYQAAFLAELSNFVYTIEIVEPLAQATDEIYEALEERYPQYRNVLRKVGDGYFGWEEHAPFDRIIVTCGIDHIPPSLLKQLSPNGVMVIPVGPPSGQTILKITKTVDAGGTVLLDREDIYKGTPVKTDRFVPFTSGDGGVHTKARDLPQGE